MHLTVLQRPRAMFLYGLLAVTLASWPDVAPLQADDAQQGRRLDSGRMETMRGLSHYLGEGSRFTVREAARALDRSRNRRDRDLLAALQQFDQRASSFHQRLDSYGAEPWDVDREVRMLIGEARRVNDRMRRVRAASSLIDDWNAVINDLNLMQRLVAGYDVRVPAAHADWSGGEHGTPGGSRGGHAHGDEQGATGSYWISGRQLSDLRTTAHELDVQARRALDAAERDHHAEGGRDQLARLRHFVGQTSALHERTDADRLDTRDITPSVTHLLDDARMTDRSMREARVFSEAWDEWAQTIALLERMASMTRR